MTLTGVRHVALSVSALERSAAWYGDVLGFRELFRERHERHSAVVMRAAGSDLVVGLVEFDDREGDGFSPRRVGLDHLCFLVPTTSDLEAWAARLDEHGVEHSGIAEMATGAILNFKDPDGIALAFATPAF